MNEQIKLCGICGYKREYIEYHRFYNACKKCATKRNAQYYETNREKIIAKSNLYQQNNKEKLTRNRKTVNSYRNDSEMLIIKVEEPTNALEMLKTTISVT